VEPTLTPTLEPTPTETSIETPTDTSLPEDFENPEGESLLLNWEGGEIVYSYDGDGNLVKSVIDNKTTYYPNQYYEKRLVDAQQTIFKYYFVGSTRIALRDNGTLSWLLSDHLGSTSGTVNAVGVLVSTMKYTAFGETRGTGSSSTDYRYTGQREEEEIGLYFYKARFYDAALGRFVQADTIVPDPGNLKSWDRYAYVNNNPINATDPSGHFAWIPALAAAGGIIGAATYGITAAVSGRSFNWIDLGVSVAVGAAGGALIGTGVGAASGVAMLATIGAGSSILGSEAGYQISSGKEFSSGELLATSAVGGVTGAITGVLGAPGMNPAVSMGAKILVNGVAGVADYSLQSVVNGQTITKTGLLSSGIIGLGSGILGNALPSITSLGGSRATKLYEKGLANTFSNAFIKPDNAVREVQRSYLSRSFVSSGFFDDVLRGAGIQAALTPIQKSLNKVLQQIH